MVSSLIRQRGASEYVVTESSESCVPIAVQSDDCTAVWSLLGVPHAGSDVELLV